MQPSLESQAGEGPTLATELRQQRQPLSGGLQCTVGQRGSLLRGEATSHGHGRPADSSTACKPRAVRSTVQEMGRNCEGVWRLLLW